MLSFTSGWGRNIFAETGKQAPNSSVKGSGANQYPSAPAHITFYTTSVQRLRSSVFDVGSTLYKCYTNVLCLLGYYLMITTQQTQNICIRLVQRRSNVWPNLVQMLYKCFVFAGLPPSDHEGHQEAVYHLWE